MSVGVFTRMKRFTFVEKTISEVGDGTEWPVLVTWDQLAEIFYRVKDFRITGGQLDFTYTETPLSFKHPTSYSVTRGYSEYSNYSFRGYVCGGSDAYNSGTYIAAGIEVSDIADNEIGMWRPVWNSPGAIWIEDAHQCTTAFSFVSFTVDDGSSWDYGWREPNGAYGIVAETRFSPRCAVVKSDPSDGIFAPTNLFYLGMEFRFVIFSGAVDYFTGGTDRRDWTSSAKFMSNYILRLSSGDVICPIYIADISEELTDVGGEDVVQEAVEWWPYNRLPEPRSIWDSSTGELVPTGSTFAAFDLDNSDLYLITF